MLCRCSYHRPHLLPAASAVVTKIEEMASKYVGYAISNGDDGIGKHEDVSSHDSSTMRRGCRG
jgi:hypothetical protein